TSSTRPPRSRVPSAAIPKPPAAFGPNHGEVAAFIKGVADLSPIQWLRVLDRRKLVSSVTREGTPEPAGVVRSIIAALESTRALDMYTRCRAFSAVERAGYALVRRHQLPPIKFAASYAPFASAIPVNNPRSLGALVSRYVTAVGRLGATQCATLAKPLQVDDGLSSVLTRAIADGSARAG